MTGSFTNFGDDILNLVFVVKALLGGADYLDNADDEPGGVGARLTVGPVDAGASFNTTFDVRLAEPAGPFEFFVAPQDLLECPIDP